MLFQPYLFRGLAFLPLLLLALQVRATTPSECIANHCAEDAVFQLAPAASLSEVGLFEGATGYKDLLRLGDTGLGALSPLEGEVIVVDGIAFHADEGGKLKKLPTTATTSFAFVKRFRADRELPLNPAANLKEFIQALDAGITSANLFYAVRIDGLFNKVLLRSVARQTPPYPPLADVVAKQHVFALKQIKGTLVGFRFPSYLGSTNAEGWHFHFVDQKRIIGGHVLDLTTAPLVAQLDESRSLTLILPEDAAFDKADFTGSQVDSDSMKRAINAPVNGGND